MRTWISIIIFSTLLQPFNLLAQLPKGFEYTLVSDKIPGVVTADFAANGFMYACDFSGKVWLFENGILKEEPILDISDEVANYGELGCLSFVLHPDFISNGYFYLLYVVDRHHLLHFGTPKYDPEANEYSAATIGRLTRFQVSLDDYKTIVPDSRTVLFGKNIGESNAVMTLSHGTGDLLFGNDGSLIFSTGDGNTWVNYFAGGNEKYPAFSFDEQALLDGILDPKQNVGSFRAQQIQSYNGKVLRINPLTGEGLESNPFYNANKPNAAESKVWALGLRNPYRMTIKPNTGSKNPEDGNPGTLYISDVGFNEWEEINVCDGPGYNFGWPLYEGMYKQNGFYNKIRENFYQPNQLANSNCESNYFTFQELLLQENGNHEYFYPNPCKRSENIANYAQVFQHSRPAFCYRNAVQAKEVPLIPSFNESGQPTATEITDSESGVEQAISFNGIAAMTGDFYAGESYPIEYQNILPVLDYQGWLKVFWFNDNNRLIKMENWLSDLENVVDMRYNPLDECYYTIGLYPSEIRKLCYIGNLSPVVTATSNPQYGTSPLLVDFDASATYDPENDSLIFHWDFGDGTESELNKTSHLYTAESVSPHSFNVILTVTDTAGNVIEKSFLISLNNTPPQVNITSIADSTLYSMITPTPYPLEADVYDEEHSIEELTFKWNSFLHHNKHFHALSSSENQIDEFNNISAVGCGPLDSYYFRVSLLVTDPEGLQGYDEVYLFPDCKELLDLDKNKTKDLLFFPNPTNGLAQLTFSEWEVPSELTIEIYSTTGQLVEHITSHLRNSNKTIYLNLQSLKNGHYTLRVTGNSLSKTVRFVVIDNL